MPHTSAPTGSCLLSCRGLTSRSKQQVSFKEGLLAPLLASASLFGLYLIIKYLPGISLQTFLDAYFWLIGTVACYGAAKPVLRQVLGSAGRPTFTLQPPEGFLRDEQGNAVGSMQYAPSDIAALVISVGLISVEVLGHHTNFTLNNMVACLVATEILSLVGLRSFKTATLLLGGLLAYDVFWVFGSPKVVGDNVMLTVATSDLVTGPTRLLFPKMPGGTGEAADFPFSLLGLGDIALPGLLAGLALRYDASRMTNMQVRSCKQFTILVSCNKCCNRFVGHMHGFDCTSNQNQASMETACRNHGTTSIPER
eukprot:GHRR01015622.1.p1 GENE.GHRR01015622.1~~GHRR01015622.1.p1  ORF type:complete len:310 (+),score=47.82 GHRR01015622.1:685-1614(+)